MKSTRVIVAALSLALLPASKAGAHAGDLDASFGQGGIAYYDSTFTGTCRRSAAAVGVQPGGSIVLAGSEYDAGGREAVVVEKLDDIGRVIAGETTTFTGQDSQSRALGIDALSGYVYVGANVGNIGYVFGYRPDLTINSGFGTGGSVAIATFGDLDHDTRINDLLVDGDIFLAGTYDGAGFGQMMMSRFGADAGNPNPISYGIFSGDNVATSLGEYGDFYGIHVILAGYDSNECFVAGFKPVYVPGGDEWNFDFDPRYADRQYGYGGTQACFTDTFHVFQDTGEQLAAGRVVNGDGSWSAYFQKLAAGGADGGVFRIFDMSPWGDNSIRKILVQADGKWIMAGFTGVDASGVPGAWAGRFNADGSTDASFGAAGSTLIDFDSQDYAYGQALSAALDRYGRVLLAGTEWTGVSDVDGNDCTVAFIARLQSDDVIFIDGFDS
jgi:hypothetical protein